MLIASKTSSNPTTKLRFRDLKLPSTSNLNDQVAEELLHLATILKNQPTAESNKQFLTLKARFAERLASEVVMDSSDTYQIFQIARKYALAYFEFEKLQTTLTEGIYVDQVQNAKQIIALGDIHGDVFGMCQMLLNAGIIEDIRPDISARDARQIKQKYIVSPDICKGTQLVSMGDYMDRGDYSMEVVEFIRYLKDAAKERGINIHTLAGNHDQTFLKIIKLFGHKPSSEIERALNDRNGESERFDFSNELLEYEELYEAAGIDLRSVTLDDLCFNFNFLNFASTYNSIVNKYSNWENAVSAMEKDGTMDFFHSLKGAVVIDGNFFTHAGPPLFARSIAELEEYYEFALNSPLSTWSTLASNKKLRESRDNPEMSVYKALRFGKRFGKINIFTQANKASESGCVDLSISYASNWDRQMLDIIAYWLSDMNFKHMYIGHNGCAKIAVDKNFTILDARLSEGYGLEAHGGILVLDPVNRNFARAVNYRNQVVDVDGYELVKTVDFIETDLLNNRQIDDIYSYNITQIIQSLDSD